MTPISTPQAGIDFRWEWIAGYYMLVRKFRELRVLCEQNRIAPISAIELRKLHDIKQTFNAWISPRPAHRDAASMTSTISAHIYEVKPRKMMNSRLINLV